MPFMAELALKMVVAEPRVTTVFARRLDEVMAGKDPPRSRVLVGLTDMVFEIEPFGGVATKEMLEEIDVETVVG
jgi:hypothetical protein